MFRRLIPVLLIGGLAYVAWRAYRPRARAGGDGGGPAVPGRGRGHRVGRLVPGQPPAVFHPGHRGRREPLAWPRPRPGGGPSLVRLPASRPALGREVTWRDLRTPGPTDN